MVTASSHPHFPPIPIVPSDSCSLPAFVDERAINSLLLAYRMQEYVSIKPAEPLPPCMSLAWHPATSQVAVASSHSHVHVCNAGAAPSRRRKQDAADLQSELLLWHEVQQQVRSATCLSELESTNMPASSLKAPPVSYVCCWHGQG